MTEQENHPRRAECYACPARMELMREIDRLKEEIIRLKDRISWQKRKAKEMPFGSSTPSSERLVKPNSPVAAESRKGGAKQGHPAHCRKCFSEGDVSEIEEHHAPETCPDCGGVLCDAGVETRDVYDLAPIRVRKIQHRIHYGFCPHCKKKHAVKPGGVMPHYTCSNRLIASVLVSHYGDGTPIGTIARRIGVNKSTLIGMEHNISGVLEHSDEWLANEFRKAPYKHADETKWRCRGKNTYTWLFGSRDVALFKCAFSRSSEVAQAVFGDGPHSGVLTCDRYAVYPKTFKGEIQHCFEHLKRAVLDVAEENPGSKDCQTFAESLSSLLREAMCLDSKSQSDADYYRRAAEIKSEIEKLTDTKSRHPAIDNIQQIFRENHDRLYHWVSDREVRPDNNHAESGLRPQVIARKISFGSQSSTGMESRGRLVSMITTMKLRGIDPEERIRLVLDQIADKTLSEEKAPEKLYLR